MKARDVWEETRGRIYCDLPQYTTVQNYNMDKEHNQLQEFRKAESTEAVMDAPQKSSTN